MRNHVILDQHAEIAHWVQERCDNVPGGWIEGDYRSIGVSRGGQLIAGFVYSTYQPEFGTVEISAAAESRKWQSRRFIHALLSYAFEDLGCQCIFARTRDTNIKAQRLLTGVEFEAVATIPRAYGRDSHAILYRLDEEVWRAGKFGKELR